MKIYAISGLGADSRIFKYLKLNYQVTVLDWINPLKEEGISSYSLRLSKKINQSEEYAILGVSFGGLIAVEISKILKPKFTILISSAENKYQLPILYRVIGRLNLIELIPASLLIPPKFISKFLFGSKNDKMLFEIINDTDPIFVKWALSELLNWSNESKINNCIKISGSKDRLIPARDGNNNIVIEGGAHFMIVDLADKISKVINCNIIYHLCKPT